MEKVWKDMSLSSTPAVLQYHHHHLPTRNTAVPVPQPRTPPPTALTLSSNLEFTYLGSSAAGAAACPSNSSSGDDSALMSSDPFGTEIFSFAAAAAASGGVHCPLAGGDRRQRRMIKNRESAARSRARKQAYNNELELELAQLRRENEMLTKRDEELNVRLAIAVQVPADRCTLQRCRSAPP